MSSTDHRYTRFFQQFGVAANIEKKRRIINFFQAIGITRIVDREDRNALGRGFAPFPHVRVRRTYRWR